MKTREQNRRDKGRKFIFFFSDVFTVDVVVVVGDQVPGPVSVVG